MTNEHWLSTAQTMHELRAQVFRITTGEVYGNNVDHGWYEESRSMGDDIALLHTEISEMYEAFRVRGIEEYTDENGKPDDFASECADVLIRLLDTCYRYKIDLAREYERKMEYNRTRPYKHGKRL